MTLVSTIIVQLDDVDIAAPTVFVVAEFHTQLVIGWQKVVVLCCAIPACMAWLDVGNDRIDLSALCLENPTDCQATKNRVIVFHLWGLPMSLLRCPHYSCTHKTSVSTIPTM